MNSPLKDLRERSGLTLERVAAQTGLSKQFIINSEQAVYVDPPEQLLRFYETDTLDEYYEYQREIRKHNYFKLIEPWVFFEAEGLIHPFINWRECSGITSARLISKLFCVHPAVMHKFEHGQMESVPDQLTAALLESGYQSRTLQGLAEAYRNYKLDKRKEVTYVAIN
jgi:transcriptional regulator with XRE-family HTH domain